MGGSWVYAGRGPPGQPGASSGSSGEKSAGRSEEVGMRALRLGGAGIAGVDEGIVENKTVARDGERQVMRALEVVDRAEAEARSDRDCRESGQNVCRIYDYDWI